MTSHRIRQLKKVIIVLPALVAAADGMGPVWAGKIGVQAQVQYDLLRTKRAGLGVTGDGRLSTNYNLKIRRPFLPTSSLMSELTVNTTNNNDANATQSTRHWMLNLYSSASKYQVIGRVNHSAYGTSSALGSSGGYATDYNAGLFLREPAYPVFNVQFMRNMTGANSSGSHMSTTWLMSSYYDYAPFRFSYDRTRQTFGYSNSSAVRMRNQTAAVKMDYPLMQGLILTGELSRANADVAYSSGITSTATNRRLLRLSATPMRSLVADIDFTSQSYDRNMGASSRNDDDKSVSCNVRSEIAPGVALDYSDQRQTQRGTTFLTSGGGNSRNRSISLSARLNDSTALNVTTLKSGTRTGDSRIITSQDAFQSALQANLSRTTDFSVNYGRNKSAAGQADSFDSSFVGASIRDRTSPRLSMGATYRRTNVRSRTVAGSPFEQVGDIVDMDMLWQPTYDMGVNLRLSYQNNKGSSASKVVAPSANLRWQLDSATNLTANYTFHKYRQFDPTAAPLGQDTRGLSVRLTHNFVNGSYVDLAYDFLGGNVGDLEWSKQFRMTFTFNL